MTRAQLFSVENNPIEDASRAAKHQRVEQMFVGHQSQIDSVTTQPDNPAIIGKTTSRRPLTGANIPEPFGWRRMGRANRNTPKCSKSLR